MENIFSELTVNKGVREGGGGGGVRQDLPSSKKSHTLGLIKNRFASPVHFIQLEVFQTSICKQMMSE